MTKYSEQHAYISKNLLALSASVFIFLATFFVFSCNNESKNGIEISSDMTRGEVLMVKNRCFNCHQKNISSSGPAYSQVSEKYSEKDLHSLVETVSKGSTGGWGSVIMPPHPDISISEIDTMVNWILAGDF